METDPQAGEHATSSQDPPAGSKSEDHSRITGNFAEHFVLYRLSRDGHECARIDTVGIDLIARHKADGKLRGISVKSRSRYEGTERESVTIVADDVDKAVKRTKTLFGKDAEAWFAIVVDTVQRTWLFLLSSRRLQEICPAKGGRHDWKMTPKALDTYRADKAIEVYELIVP